MSRYIKVFATFITGAGIQYFIDFIGLLRAFFSSVPQ